MKKKLFIGLVVVAVASAALYFLLLAPRGAAVAANTTVAALPPVEAGNKVTAEARVLPLRSAKLSLPAGGVVVKVLVTEGDSVIAGQTLVQVDSARQAAAVAQAEAQLKAAQARLAELKAGARAGDREAAQAGLDAAQARLDRIQSGPLSAESAAAQAALAEARAALSKVSAGADEGAIIAAQADASNAEAALRMAQAGYDRVKGDANIAARPEALQLEQATNTFNAARARLAELQKGADSADIAAARARVAQAQAQADLLIARHPADVSAAEAEVRRLAAGVKTLNEGATPEQIAMAEAEVAAAEAAVSQAQSALADTELRAPFAGVVAALEAVEGEQAGSGTPLVWLADLSAWEIETDDLTELNVVKINVGDPAVLRFDALPGLELPGSVKSIKALGENKQGDITYTVLVVPARADPRLRWNMTASVEMEGLSD